MKLLIEIPKEFEQHFWADRFEEGLHRLSADSHLLAGLYEQETALMLSEAFQKATPVPDHGDLIDRKALLDKVTEVEIRKWNGSHFVTKIIRVITEEDLQKAPMEAPTIIPKEAGE